MINATLVVVGGESENRELKLNLPTVLGRGRDASVTVQHSLVSRLHCEIFEREGRLYVRDLQSLNGTYINNFKIVDEEPLLPGQLLTLGNMTFRATYEMPEGMTEQDFMPTEMPATNRQKLDTVRAECNTPFSGQEITAYPDRADSIEPDQMTTAAVNSSAGSSDILDGIEFLATPQKSISISALGNLPGQQPAVSFIGDFQGARPLADADTSSIDLDVAESVRKKVEADDSKLGSFVRKLPR